jgi:hypothetical protein
MSLKPHQSRIFHHPTSTPIRQSGTYLGIEDILVEGDMVRIVKEEIEVFCTDVREGPRDPGGHLLNVSPNQNVSILSICLAGSCCTSSIPAYPPVLTRQCLLKAWNISHPHSRYCSSPVTLYASIRDSTVSGRRILRPSIRILFLRQFSRLPTRWDKNILVGLDVPVLFVGQIIRVQSPHCDLGGQTTGLG